MKLPTVSVIIPTFNEERLLPACLDSLAMQEYPQDLIELIVVDDGSTDATLALAKKYGAITLHSGKKHIEASKTLGIAKSTGELLLFVDADVQLIGKDWLSVAVQSLIDNPQAAGVQNVYWQYRPTDSLMNRYCELTGVNDPFILLLGRRGILGYREGTWPDPSVIVEEKPDYFVARFTPDRLPTLGSQGYLTRRKLIVEETLWEPHFFHLDAAADLVIKGHTEFILLKHEVRHDYVSTLSQYFRKVRRNILLFLKYQSERRYTYELGSGRFLLTTLLMVTVLYPLWQAIRGYQRVRDSAWFLHPLLCLAVPAIYAYVVIRWKLGYGKDA
jgi:glycosyltransferase involved in cell wall biosynthesis